jgi:glycosyltransferase involved in cell wall biosynthesis
MEDGERDFYFNRGADGQLSIADLTGLNLKEYDIVHFGSATGFLPGPLQATYIDLLNKAKEAGALISFDPNYRHLLFPNNTESFITQSWHYIQACDFFKLSDEEAMLITELDTVQAAATALRAKTNAVFAKWKERFPIVSYRSKKELSEKLQSQEASVLYQIKAGPFDGFVVPGVRNCIHSMFLSDEFHGDRFAYVSAWASRVMTLGDKSFVPHYVPKLVSAQNLRKSLGIPAKAKVFGRHGGWETFNIPFAREVVARHARLHSGDHFIFLNTEPIREGKNLPNIHYLEATVDPEKKAQFLASCDAMIHARDTGETFGLAVAEFAVLEKAVITYGGSKERAHLEMLGKQARIYNVQQELQKILEDFEPGVSGKTEYQDWADPTQVMSLFREKFLS